MMELSHSPRKAHQKERTSSLPGASQTGRASTAGSKKKTQTELDEELRQKMDGIAGDGGESGVEYENGKPVAMKRSVRENMFRYI
jgi:hypothetical protein